MTSATVHPRTLAPPQRQSVRRNLRPLLPYFRKYWRGLAFATVSVLLDNGIWIMFPLVLGRAINDLREASPAKSWPSMRECWWGSPW